MHTLVLHQQNGYTTMSYVKNIIFDIGNVLLKFYPNNPMEDSVIPIVKNVEVLLSLSENYRLIALSDAPVEQIEFEIKKFPFFKVFEEIMLSQNLGFEKNDPLLYAYLLQQKELIPNECVFIDDRVENIQAAQSAGILTLLYDSTDINLASALNGLSISVQ